MQHISRREMMELRSSSHGVELKNKPDKPRAVPSGVGNSFGFKRRVVSAPPATEPVQSFCDVTDMETKLEARAVNKFGFRSRSVSRTNSNNSVNSAHSNTTANLTTANATLVKKPLDNNRNTLLVTNINRQPASKIATSNLVKYRSSSETNSRPSNLNKITNTTTANTQDSTHIPRNINSRSGIPSLRPVSTCGIPSLPKYSSGNVAPGNYSNLSPRASSTRPVSWCSSPWSNGADKTGKPIYANSRSRTPSSLQAKPSPARSASANKLPRRRLEMVTSNNDRGRFELKDVEVTHVVPIKPEKKSARGTVYETLCKPTLRRPRGLVPSKASPAPARPLSSLLSSSDDSDQSEADSSPTSKAMKPFSQVTMMSSGSDMDGGEAGVDMDVMEGSGDTMALELDEEEVKAESPGHSLDVNTNMRSILLNIEDPAFAVLAAMSTNERLEDVGAPDSPSTSESTELAPPPQGCLSQVQTEKTVPKSQHASPIDLKNSVFQHVNHTNSPPELDSPGTPTNVSFSDGEGEGGRGQDFLIDDEISDQPGLVFDEDQTATLHHRERSRQKHSNMCQDSPARSRGTLSPCSSIASEDLMLDFELSEVDNTQRLADKTIENLFITNPPNALRSNCNNNHYTDEKVERGGRESTYVGTVDLEDDEEPCSVSTDSGYSFLGHLEDDVANIKTELVALRSVLSRERDGFVEKEADLKRQIMLLKQECMEQVRVASLLREELEVYKTKDQRRHKLIMKSNASTQTERSRPSSLGYVSEGSDGSTRSLISFHLGHGKFG